MDKKEAAEVILRLDEQVERIRRTLTPRELEVLDTRFGLGESPKERDVYSQEWLEKFQERCKELDQNPSPLLTAILKRRAEDANE